MSDQYDLFMQQALGAINWAYEKMPAGLTILPPTITEVKQQDPAKPEKHPATMTVVIPEALAKQLKADQDEAGLIYIVHVRGELVQMAAQRAESKLYLPGDDA